jgi:hypothetical protein
MKRLQTVRLYLQQRHTECQRSHMTIFHEISKGSFPERYYDESPSSSHLKMLHERIEKAAQDKRESKTKEWMKKTAEYEDLLKRHSESSCVYYTDEFLVRIHVPHCRKCFLE